MSAIILMFVRQFYIANAGFFLLVIGFAGGFMRSYDHIALAEFFISTPALVTLPITMWLLYALMMMNFNQETVRQKENEFIYCFIILPIVEQWWMVVRVVTIQLLPVFLYAAFLCLIGWKHGLIYSVVTIAVGIMLVVTISACHFRWWLHHPNYEAKTWLISRFLNPRLTRPFPLFFIEWIVRKDLAMLAGSKIFSGLIIWGTTALYKTDTYDVKLLSIGILIAVTANAGIILSVHRVENFHLHFVRGLPIPFLRRVSSILISFAVLLLPETIILAKNFPAELPWIDCVNVISFLFSIPIFFYGILYVKDRNQDEIMPIVFYCVIGWFVLILFNAPPWLLGIVNAAAGIMLWKKFYYSFEYQTRQTPRAKNQTGLLSE
ncbi:MAG TPA: hypothetical protein VFZ52_07655 [Chryseolinea sp.]